MSYSYQTFSVGQVLTAAQMTQVEDNVRDHGHGLAGVLMAIPVVAAGGTVNAITATYSPAMSALVQGVIVGVECSGANTGPATFNPNALGEKSIYKGNNLELESSDIPGANYVAYLRYDSSLDKWQYINATGVTAVTWAMLVAKGIVDG